MIFHSKISENYAWELTLLDKYRDIKDGLSIVEFTCNLDWYKGDHSPRFELSLRLCNRTIFEFNVYNTNHYEEEDLEE